MTISGRTISRLARPFEGGSGPSHSAIENIWLSEEASDYLPTVGNKADRVRGGLKALRDGRPRGSFGPEVAPSPSKLRRVAAELAERLVSQALVSEEEVAEALGQDLTGDVVAPKTAAVTSSQSTPKGSSPSLVRNPTSPIFVVHGHDHGLLNEAVRVLERVTWCKVTVLHEQAKGSRVI